MPLKRIRAIWALFFIAILCLLIKVGYFQIFSFNGFTQAASTQRTNNTPIAIDRGEILDRNGIPFTDRTEKESVVIKPLLLQGHENEIQGISGILNLDLFDFNKKVEAAKLPLVYSVDEIAAKSIAALKSNAVSVIHSLQRYDSNTLAHHVLGYLNGLDGHGETGIERAYEKLLKNSGNQSIEVITDALKNPLQGLGYKVIKNTSGKRQKNVKLTLDYHIQKIVEAVMDRNEVNGAVVVEDVSTGDIAAIASKPDFDQNSVDSFLDSPRNELFNKSVASYNLGSIFKIIDVAQALESGLVPEEHFYCPGWIRIGNREFRCTSYEKGGHGEVNLTSAFALSCNPYFIDMGQKLGYQSILTMARKFGLGGITGLKDQGVDESSGNLPDPEKPYSPGDLANVSIGQGEVMATPLQVADLVATVANGGIKNRINIVDAIVDGEGNVVENLKRKEGQRIISKSTAETIKGLMEEVVISGTGKKADIPEYGGSAGKTGSAETGLNNRNDKVVQAWFAGYFPRVEPRYAISVFIENGKMGGQAAAPIFREIAEEIMQKGY